MEDTVVMVGWWRGYSCDGCYIGYSDDRRSYSDDSG